MTRKSMISISIGDFGETSLEQENNVHSSGAEYEVAYCSTAVEP
jgi:hypothetical protein